MDKIALPLLMGLLCLPLSGQVKKEIFESFKLQERRNVSYYFPEDYSEDKKYPLLLVLDGQDLFELVVANAKFQSRLDRMPQVIVVGVEQGPEQRWEDCGFDPDSGLPDEKGRQFYEFLGTELIPYLETHYSLAPFKMFLGHDVTANFGNFYLFKERSLFNAYVSISPVLAPEMEVRVPERLSALDQEIFYTLILENQASEDRQRILQMNHSIASITKENIHYTFDQYDHADHTSIMAYGLGKAFDDVFRLFRPISPQEYRTEILTSQDPAFAYLENRYASLEKRFGYRKPVSLNDIMAIYAACKKKEDVESLKPLAELSKKEFPDTMLGFFLEGEYYEGIGEPKKAFKTFEKAFQLQEIDFLTKDMALQKIDALKADFGY